MKKEMLVKKLGEKFYEEWQEQVATEVTVARNTIINALKELGTSLPAAVFAVDLVKMELVRSQLEEFLGKVKLSKELPLKSLSKAKTE